MTWYNWKLFSLMLLLVPVIWVINQKYRREASLQLRNLQETWSRLASTLAESVSGIKVTQAFVRQETNAGFFRKLVDLHGENNVGLARASAVFIPLLQMKSQLFLGVTALLSGYGALRWQGSWHMEVGDLVMFFFLANFFFDPVQVIGNQYSQALTAMAVQPTRPPVCGRAAPARPARSRARRRTATRGRSGASSPWPRAGRARQA